MQTATIGKLLPKNHVKPMLRTHMFELFSTIRARMSGSELRVARPAGDQFEISDRELDCGLHPHMTGILTDPYDGQRYRIVLVHESQEVIVR